ncbi:MAG: hypothetical protein KAY24_03365 [Candidatus Eisenbacteria sp.]|nr:hypothetical protein [Candidatus Eisenbacteria bacterium]
MPRILIALVTVGLAAGIAHADPSNLESGVFIAHYPALLEFSSNPPPEGWCQHYLDSYAITACEDQVNRIDTQGGVVWFVLAAWSESKEWCAVEFGLGSYDAAAFLITDHGACFPEAGLELPSDNWPGPNEGTAITVTGDPWLGNLQPVYYFSGYAYSAGVIPLAVDPGANFGGTANCENPPLAWDVAAFGAMGMFTDGIYACPQGGIPGGHSPGGNEAAVCCFGEECRLMTPEACEEAGGEFHPEWGDCTPNPCDSPPGGLPGPAVSEDDQLGLVFECLDWDNLGCPGNQMACVMEYWLGEENVEHLVERELSDDPTDRTIQLWNWTDQMPRVTHASFITHGASGVEPAYILAAESHDNENDMLLMRNYWREYYGVDSSYVGGAGFAGQTVETAWAVCFTEQAISDWLTPVYSSDGIILASACQSCSAHDYWHLDDCASYLCYEGHPVPADACPDIDSMTVCLCCEMPLNEQVFPDAYTCHMAQAPFQGDLRHYGGCYRPRLRRWCGGIYANAARECVFTDATFECLHACADEVLYRTARERGLLVHLLQGTDVPGKSGPDAWDTLARITPRNERGVIQTYYLAGVPTKAAYRIIALEPSGRYTTSHTFRQGPKPTSWDRWIHNPRQRTLPPRDSARGRLFMWKDGQSIPFEQVVAAQEAAIGGDGPMIPDSTNCADVIVYTSEEGVILGFLPRFALHLHNYDNLKYVLYSGGYSLEDARDWCSFVHEANLAYNAASGTDRFPTKYTEHRPLLTILGDSEPLIVDHWWFADEDSLCECSEGDPCCVSDRLVWDLDGDGNWFGLVHRVPADTWDELHRACIAAEQWNEADQEYVDLGRKVIMTVGDYGEMAQEYTLELAQEAADQLLAIGFNAHDLLVETDFSPWCNDPAKKQAYREQLEAGAVMDWGFGERISACHWPGWFLSFPDSFPSAPCQRMIAMQAGCHTVNIASTDPFPPFIEAWMFNDLDKTVFAGAVGHLLGGWLHQNRLAQKLYLDAWLNLCFYGGNGDPSYPLDWIVLSAAEAARTQGIDQMEQYFLSAATMGAYVMALPGGECVPDMETEASEPAWPTFHLSAEGIPGSTPRLRLSLPSRCWVCLRIYDASGRHVSTLQDGILGEGTFFKTWLGMNLRGEEMPSGVYFARLEADGHLVEQERIVLVR